MDGVDKMRRVLGGAGHSALKGGEVGGDTIDVQMDHSLLAFGDEEGFKVAAEFIKTSIS